MVALAAAVVVVAELEVIADLVDPASWPPELRPRAAGRQRAVWPDELRSEGMRGTVKWFNDAKGHGFIVGADGREVFVHYSSISGDGFRTLVCGQIVEYEEQQGPKGLYALRVSPVSSGELA